MSIKEFVKSCAKKVKNFVIRCWKKAKQFIADHKREVKTVCGGACLFISGALLGYWIYKARSPVTFLDGCNARAGMGIIGAEDLVKPNWGKGYDIQEHWTEKNRGNGVMDRMMILDTFLPHLGELGEKLINDENCWANPDLPVSLILGYGVG